MITKINKSPISAFFTTVGVADLNGFQAFALAVLDDLNVSCVARNAILNVGNSFQVSFSSRGIGPPKYLWKQACVAGITICKQSNPMRVTQAVRSILE
jgi:hypothetical protein